MGQLVTPPADRDFARRVKQISRRHSRLSKGYLMAVNDDGLVVAQPRRLGLRFPLRTLLSVALAALAFKAFALAYLGDAAYAERVAALRSGTGAERLAGVLMEPEAATRTLAAAIAPLIR